MNGIVFEDEIVLFWDRVKTLGENESYTVFLDGKMLATTQKTHYNINGLSPDTEYSVQVKLVGKTEKPVGLLTLKTKAEPKLIVVTNPPYNAVGDGKTLNTVAIQKALDDCKAGDCVRIPKGVFLSGGLTVHPNTYIYIEKGGVLKGSENFCDYLPKIKSRFEGIERECYKSLLNIGELNRNGGYNCRNVIIRGKGSIFGGGKELCKSIIDEETKNLKEYMDSLGGKIREYECVDTIPGRSRGRLIQTANCDGVVISGLELGNGPSWNIHFIYSKNVVITGCYIKSKGVHNGDGIDPDSSENCFIFDTTFETGDDCIAIKSGKNPEGNIINKPSKDIKIFDCKAVCGHSFAMGSEMSGGIENVEIWDCDISNTPFGISIKSAEKRGGYIKNIKAFDTKTSKINIVGSVGYNNDGESAKTLPKLSDFHFENIFITGVGRYINTDGNFEDVPVPFLEIQGLDKKGCEIENVSLTDCVAPRPLSENSKDVKLKNVKGLKIVKLK